MDKDKVRLRLGAHFHHPITQELAIVMAAVLALPEDDRNRVPEACAAFFCVHCGGEPRCDCNT